MRHKTVGCCLEATFNATHFVRVVRATATEENATKIEEIKEIGGNKGKKKGGKGTLLLCRKPPTQALIAIL
jgi:hypothetical protein